MNLFYGVCENHGRVLVPENIFNVAIESGSFKTYGECCSECKIAFKKTGHLIIKKSKHKCQLLKIKSMFSDALVYSFII